MKYAMSHTQHPQQPLQAIEEIKTCIAIQSYRAGTYVQLKIADQIHSSGSVSNTLDGAGHKAMGIFLQTDETDYFPRVIESIETRSYNWGIV